MKSRFPLLIAAAAAAALALPGAAQAATPYYPSGPQQNVSRADVAASGWTVCYTSLLSQDWQYFSYADDACTGEYLMLASGVASDPDNWTLLAAAPRSVVLTTRYTYLTPDVNFTVNANGSEWHRGSHTAWGFAAGGDTLDHDWDVCDRGTAHPELRLCWNAWYDGMTFGGRVGTTQVPMGSAMSADYSRAVLQFTPNVHATATPLTFPAQPLSTVSAKQTVTFSVSGRAGLTEEERALGKLKVTGADTDEFDIIENDCPAVAPDGDSLTCTVTVRFVPQASGPHAASLSFANTVERVTLTGTGGQLPQGPAGDDGADGNDGNDGNDGKDGATGPQGPAGKDGANGNDGINGKDGANGRDGKDGAKGDKGVAVKFAKRNRTHVGCKMTARGAGARIVCRFNRRAGRNWLVQLRDRRGALSTARGHNEKTMVFLSARKPRGSVHAYVIKGLPAS